MASIAIILLTSFVKEPHIKEPQKTNINAPFWPTNVIPVCWLNPTKGNEEQRDLVKHAISRTWEAASDLRFTGWCKCAEYKPEGGNGIRILIDDVPAESSIGVVADKDSIGMKLNFDFKNTYISLPVASKYYSNDMSEVIWPDKSLELKKLFIEAQAVHEFGHAIGFSHEQIRSDCNQGSCTNFEKINTVDKDAAVVPCNERSVMNYCNDIYLNEGYLSVFDEKQLQHFYPLSEKILDKPIVIKYIANERTRKSYKKYKLNDDRPQQQNAPIVGKKILAKSIFISIYTDKIHLNNIEKVQYYFHRGTFKPMLSKNEASNYQVELTKVWGNFMCEAKIWFKDGTSTIISQYIFADNDKENIHKFELNILRRDGHGKGGR